MTTTPTLPAPINPEELEEMKGRYSFWTDLGYAFRPDMQSRHWELLRNSISLSHAREIAANALADLPRCIAEIERLRAEGDNPEGNCLSDTLKNRARQLSAAGRHYDARLMESAGVYLELFRDEKVPALSKEIERLRAWHQHTLDTDIPYGNTIAERALRGDPAPNP